jgi:hypothetical protein
LASFDGEEYLDLMKKAIALEEKAFEGHST